jgi:hypothetical protein
MRPVASRDARRAIYEAGGRGVKRGLGFELRLAVFVITGLVPVIHVLPCFLRDKTWMAGSSPAMTEERVFPLAGFGAFALRNVGALKQLLIT